MAVMDISDEKLFFALQGYCKCSEFSIFALFLGGPGLK